MLHWIKLQYLSLMQERLIFKPHHHRVKPLLPPIRYDLPNMKNSIIRTKDHIQLHIWHQSATRHGMPTIVFWQGNMGHIADVGAPKKGEDYHPDYRLRLLRALLEEGYGFVYAQPRDFGNSQRIRPSEVGMWHDVRAVNDFCINTLTLEPNEIAPLGESLGACYALMSSADLATRYTAPPLVSLIAPFASIAKKIEENHPDIDVEKATPRLRHTLNNMDYIDELNRNTHVLLITPEADLTTAPWHSDLLATHMESRKQPHTHHTLNDAGHITWTPDDIVELLADARAALK